MSPLYALHLWSLIQLSNGKYFLSANKFSQHLSEQFCPDYCDSHLVSVHNQSQFQRITEIATNTKIYGMYQLSHYGAWIGLQKPADSSNMMNFSWTDSTPFNYGNVGYESPWDSSAPDGKPGEFQNCVRMMNRENYLWNDKECREEYRFMCDSCIGKMNKYFIIKQKMNFSDADQYCQYFGTSLASIYSEYDYFEAKTICETAGSDCWVGVNSYFEDDCVSIEGDCDDEAYFLCNKPSEIYGNDTTTDWILDDYNMSKLTIKGKQWEYDDDIWVIDYLFTINDINNGYGMAGVFINITDSVQEYYIGVDIGENEAHIFINHNNYTSIENEILYDLGEYQTLRIQLTYHTTYTIWNVSMNEQFIWYNDTVSISYIQNAKSVGLFYKNANITAKSVFISDAPTWTSIAITFSYVCNICYISVFVMNYFRINRC